MLVLIINSFLLGVGLAMDAFSVSLANGLNEPKMKRSKMLFVAGMFGIFQGLMPLIGWACVHTLATYFEAFQKFIPWIALVLLAFIGGKMLLEGIKCKPCEEGSEENCCCTCLGIDALLLQGIATSIDALSVGFTISDYVFIEALISAFIIAALTFVICFAGIKIGKRFGTRLADKASIFGGMILILIGLEIFITGII